MPKAFVISLPQGKLRGQIRAHDVVFYNIPYAAAPQGLHRFTAPVQHSGWIKIRNGQQPGPSSQRAIYNPNPTIPERIIHGSETLNLSVFTPRSVETGALRDLPVLVWFHGGSFHSGSNSQLWYDGAAFTKAGIIVVSVGYRLGLDGFLSLPDAPSNRALRDWVMALEWVRDTISLFGGNPHHVTIAGQSAGGNAVLTLLASPVAQGLFHQGIAQSPATVRLADDDYGSRLRRVVRGVLRGKRPSAALLSSMRNSEIDQILRSTLRLLPLGMPLHPIIDAETLPVPAGKVFAKETSTIPLLIGATSEEFDHISIGKRAHSTRFIANASLRLSGLDSERRLAFLDRYSLFPVEKLVGRTFTDSMIKSAVVGAAEKRASIPNNAPTWVYDYAWPGVRGAAHCTDIPLTFGLQSAQRVDKVLGESSRLATIDDPSSGRLSNPTASTLGDAMHASWCRFITTGNPGWQPYAPPDRVVMEWGESIRVVPDALKHVRAVWTH